MFANLTQKPIFDIMDKADAENITICSGDAQDIETIMPIMKSAFDPQYGEAWNSAQCYSMLASPYVDLYLAQYEKDICGFVFTRSIYEDVELLMIATHRNYTRKGVATALMNYIIKIAKNSDRKRVFLEMRQGNSAEIIYNLFDFTNISLRKNYYKGHNNIYYNAITKELLL